MLAERSWVVCLVEPPDIWMSRLEQQMTKVEARATFNQLRLVNERHYVDTNFGEVNETLIGLTLQNENCGRNYKKLEHMQQELNIINTEIAIVCNA